MSSFVVLTFLVTWSLWFFLVVSGLEYERRLWKYLYVAGLSGPLAASLGVTLLLEGKRGPARLVERVLMWKFSPVWYLVSVFLPALLMLGAAGIYHLISRDAIELPRLTFSVIVLLFAYMIVRGGPANEELGWRGFLLPRLLQAHSPFWASLILFPIWMTWHVPLWFLTGLPHPYWPFHYFALLVAPLTFLFTWLHLRAKGSVLVAILFHASINTTIQFLPMLPPRHPGLAPFALWIAITWAVALCVIGRNPDSWFSRQPPASEQKKI